MSLDIAILGNDGSPAEQVGIGVETHWKLIEAVKQHPDSILLRMADYYCEDTQFETEEVNQVIEEIKHLFSRCKEDVELTNFLSAFKKLASTAEAQGKPLVVISD
jgi:hypothetical protein